MRRIRRCGGPAGGKEKTIMKRFNFFSTLTLLAMLLMGTLSMSGAGEYQYLWHDGLYYSHHVYNPDKTVMVSPAPNNEYLELTGTVTIPETITVIDTIYGTPQEMTYTVIAINSSAFKGCEGINEFRLPNSILYLYNSAFEGCTGLSSFDIPSSVTKIQKRAFYGCTGLTSITIPENISTIEDSIVGHCPNITSLIWNATNCTRCVGWDYSNITQLSIGDNVQTLPSLFMMASPITAIELPQSLKTIEGWAFRNCPNLTEVNIPDSVTLIRNYAFAGDTILKKVTIGRSVTNIETYCFSACHQIQQIHWKAISCPSAGAMVISTMLPEVTFGEGIEILPRGLFNSTAVAEVTIPSTVKEFASSCLSGCKRLKSITLPEGLVTIGGGAFNSCDSITSLDIPNTVKTIGNYAFSYMRNLQDLSLSNTLDSVGYGLIAECLNINHLDIPKTLIHISDGAFQSARVKSLTVEEGNPVIDSRENCNGIIETATNTLIFATRQLTTIPASVTTIGDYAFDLCSGPDYYDVPEGVTYIGKRAFYRCWGLAKITLPSTLDSIGDLAFYYTGPLNNIICKAVTPPVIHEEWTFDWHYNPYATLYVPAESVEAYKEANVWNKFLTIVPIGTVLIPGDANCDGVVDIQDVSELIDLLLYGETTYHPNLDTNYDHSIDLDDVTRLIDLLLWEGWQPED